MSTWMWFGSLWGHEKSALHEHIGGVVVSLTEAHLRFTDENGKVREVYSKPGEARWYPPFKHKVENLGDTSYEGVYIGVKGRIATGSNGSSDPLTAMDEEMNKIVAAFFWHPESRECIGHRGC